MNSAVLPSFWDQYTQLNQDIQHQAKKAFRLWSENPFHPSLRFKCINKQENIWAVRVSLGYRAIGVMDQNTVTWFWIGDHDQYEKFFG